MSYLFIIPALLAQIVMVGGQVLLKKAMLRRTSRERFGPRFFAAIACMTVYFFLWLAVARTVPLSQLAPFDALGPVLLVAAVHAVLRERLSGRAWIGVILIVAGIAVIACS